jgi:ribosomal protein RSM22 (predicted rRNA methylase)
MNLNKKLDKILPFLIQIWRKKNGFTNPKLPSDKLTDIELNKIGKSLKLLSKGLTEERLFVGEKYLDDREFLGSYLLYFWVKSYVQALFVFSQICFQGIESALDLGGGPGPISTALSDVGFKKITIVDNSKRALNISSEIFSSLGIGQKVRICRLDLMKDEIPSIPEKYDCAVISHALNELWHESANKIQLRSGFISGILDKLITSKGILIVIEPALFNITKEMLLVRDILIKNGKKIIYPCFNDGCCPVLTSENSTCHQEIKWTPPRLVSKIASIPGFHINPLPAGILIIGNNGYEIQDNNEYYRVISQRMLSKSGKYRFLVCGKEGKLTISARKDEVIPAYDDFIKLKKGDVIFFENCQKTENGYILNDKSSLRIINGINKGK